MKIFKSKEEKAFNKQKKTVTKKAKQIETTLNWIDVKEITSDSIILNRGKREETVKGIKIFPPSIFMEETNIKQTWVTNLKYCLSRLDFDVYHNFVYTPFDVDFIYDEIRERIEKEENPQIIEMFDDEVDTYNYMHKNVLELSFFIMVKSKSKADEQLAELKKSFNAYNFNFKELNQYDYKNLIAYEFNNEHINEFLFSINEFSILKQEFEKESEDE